MTYEGQNVSIYSIKGVSVELTPPGERVNGSGMISNSTDQVDPTIQEGIGIEFYQKPDISAEGPINTRVLRITGFGTEPVAPNSGVLTRYLNRTA